MCSAAIDVRNSMGKLFNTTKGHKHFLIRRWITVKRLLQKDAGVTVNFRETAELQEDTKTDRYSGAYFYAIKGDNFTVSEGNPNMQRKGEDAEDHHDKGM